MKKNSILTWVFLILCVFFLGVFLRQQIPNNTVRAISEIHQTDINPTEQGKIQQITTESIPSPDSDIPEITPQPQHQIPFREGYAPYWANNYFLEITDNGIRVQVGNLRFENHNAELDYCILTPLNGEWTMKDPTLVVGEKKYNFPKGGLIETAFVYEGKSVFVIKDDNDHFLTNILPDFTPYYCGKLTFSGIEAPNTSTPVIFMTTEMMRSYQEIQKCDETFLKDYQEAIDQKYPGILVGCAGTDGWNLLVAPEFIPDEYDRDAVNQFFESNEFLSSVRQRLGNWSFPLQW